MNILYVSQYFSPEMGAPAARVYELARAWVKNGHKVTVLTGFANHPTGVKDVKDRGVLTRRETLDGIDVLRCYVWATPNKDIMKRMISFAVFMMSAIGIGSMRASRPQVVIATSPQLLCGLAGYVLAKRFFVPFVLEVRDLWPESILAVEAMENNFIVRGLRRLAQFLYEQAEVIVTVGGGYKREIHERYGVAHDRLKVIPNGVDTDLFIPGPRQNEIRRDLGWGDRFVVLYIGTHGMAHALHVVLEAAEKLRSNPHILFVFVGEGAEKEHLKNLAKYKALENVQFIDQQPRHRVPLFYDACDMGIVSLRKSKLFQSVLPSKIFEYLAMAKPILLTIDGEARKLVEEAQAGWFVPPEDSAALYAAVLEAFNRRVQLPHMGQSGREYVLRYYDRKVLAKDYERVLASLV